MYLMLLNCMILNGENDIFYFMNGSFTTVFFVLFFFYRSGEGNQNGSIKLSKFFGAHWLVPGR